MEAKVTFHGCSCGCTPYTTKVIMSDTREGLLYGLSSTILDYRVYGDSPYRKCSWEVTEAPDNPISDLEIIELADKIYSLEEQIIKKENESEKAFKPIYATSSKEYPLTPEQETINKNAHDAFLKEQEMAKEEVKNLEKQKASFYVAHSVYTE